MNYLKILNEDDVNEASFGGVQGDRVGMLSRDAVVQLKYEARDAINYLKEMKRRVGTTIGQISNAAQMVDKRNSTFSINGGGEDAIDEMIAALNKFVADPMDKNARKAFLNAYEKANQKGQGIYNAVNLAKFINSMDAKSVSSYGEWLSGSGNNIFNLMNAMNM